MFMANYAQTVNVIGAIKTSKTESAFATTGLVLKLYRQRFGSLPLEITGAPEPLDVAAAWAEGRDAVTVAVVNPTLEPYTLPVDWQGGEPQRGAKRWTITGTDPMAYNEPGKDEAVSVREEPLAKVGKVLTVPPWSICLYRLPVR